MAEERFYPRMDYFDKIWNLYVEDKEYGGKLSGKDREILRDYVSLSIGRSFGVQGPFYNLKGGMKIRADVFQAWVNGKRDLPKEWREDIADWQNRRFINRSDYLGGNNFSPVGRVIPAGKRIEK